MVVEDMRREEIFHLQEELEEMSSTMQSSVISPLLETTQQIRRYWQDPASEVFLGRLAAHRELLESAGKMLSASIEELSEQMSDNGHRLT